MQLSSLKPSSASGTFSPIVARTESRHTAVNPIAFDCVKLIVVRAGGARLFSAFGNHHVNIGDVVMLATNTLCGAEPEGWITTTTLYLDRDYLIDQVFWQYAAQFCDRHNARDFFDAHYSTPAQIVHIGEDRAGHLMPWLDELTALSLDGPQPERFLRAQALLFSVLDVIVPFMTTTAATVSGRRGSTVIPAAPRHRQFTPLRVEARHIAQLIRDDPAHQWTVPELAEAVHLSPSQLRRVFVEAFGKAPIAYLTMVRTERMAQLLRSTVLPIKQIAADVGWADADFAARQFRRGLGATPTAYRQFVCGSGSDDAA
ncbi:hypothetical protein GCM10025789_03470 [Tessaracoccus lubricantis]|uniref:HTH araC/xylS-type domain-containing protein n=1 Tax=Tessaracoccus lubricantis TaxID=545543 RepID=A0ABP9EYL8_9ACTN